LLSQTAAFMPRRAKIGEAFSTQGCLACDCRVTLSNPATSRSRRLTKPPRHVGPSPNLVDEYEPRRVQTGLPLASLEHAGSEKGEQLYYGHVLARYRPPGEMLAGVDRDHLSGHVARSTPLAAPSPARRRAKRQNQIRRPSPSVPMPAFPKRGKAVCRNVEGIKSNRIMLCQSNRWNFVGSLLSSLSAVCLLAYAAAVRTLREARPPQEGNGQDLEAETRSRRWAWTFCVLRYGRSRRPNMATATPANIIGILQPTSLCCPIATRSIQAQCCGVLRFRTESPRMNRREDIFDSGALAGLGLPCKSGEPTTLRGPSGHDRDTLSGYVHRAPPQPDKHHA
jgi:hypothetical protein